MQRQKKHTFMQHWDCVGATMWQVIVFQVFQATLRKAQISLSTWPNSPIYTYSSAISTAAKCCYDSQIQRFYKNINSKLLCWWATLSKQRTCVLFLQPLRMMIISSDRKKWATFSASLRWLTCRIEWGGLEYILILEKNTITSFIKLTQHYDWLLPSRWGWKYLRSLKIEQTEYGKLRLFLLKQVVDINK